jgi:hypothetical protein
MRRCLPVIEPPGEILDHARGRVRWIADRKTFDATRRQDEQPSSIGRPMHGLRIARDVGRQARLAAVEWQDPGLLPTATIRDEGERLAVG